MVSKMNAAMVALLVYKHIRENPQESFTVKDFYEEPNNISGFGINNGFTEKRIRTAFDNIIQSGLVVSFKENSAIKIQYAPDNQIDISNEDKQKAIINAIAGKQYMDLNFGTKTKENPFLEPESQGQAQWMDWTIKKVTISEKQKIMLDSTMLDYFITLVEHYQKKVWSIVYLLDENEEPKEKPLEISFIKMVLQDKHFHCLGIKRTEEGYTGDKFFLNDIHSIEKGEKLSRTQDYKELTSFIEKVDAIPDFFSQEQKII